MSQNRYYVLPLASSAFGRLKKAIWSKRSISLQLKSRLYRALILPIATYASETWTLKSEDVRKLEVFERRCLRAILGITRLHKVKNEQVYKRLCMENTITDVIKNKRLRWFGHLTRKPNSSMVSKAYRDDFKNPRPRGRPPKRWAAQIREDTGVPLATAERRASDRGSWRRSARVENARGRRGLSS